MEYKLRQRSEATGRQTGLTLVELIVTVAILAILASAAVPLLRFQVKREKEKELRGDLRKMRMPSTHTETLRKSTSSKSRPTARICLLTWIR